MVGGRARGWGGERTPSLKGERENTPEREKLSQRERDRETELCGSAEHGRAFLCSPAGPLGKAAKALRENSCMQ